MNTAIDYNFFSLNFSSENEEGIWVISHAVIGIADIFYE